MATVEIIRSVEPTRGEIYNAILKSYEKEMKEFLSKKSKQDKPLLLSEHEFFFVSGSRTMKYVCSGKDRSDAELTALDAMRGSYFKLRDQN